MTPDAIEFRPSRPPLRKLWPTIFLSFLFAVLVLRTPASQDGVYILGMIGLGSLIAGGTWLWFRQRFPGDPTLRVDAIGMSFVRGGSERHLKWSEVRAIRADYTLERMLFVPTTGDKPIAMHLNMVSADGQQWAMLIENYWEAPDDQSEG